MKPLTPNEERIFRAICDFMSTEGKSPTYSDIEDSVPGMSMSWSHISRALKALEEAGKILRPAVGVIEVPGLEMPEPKTTAAQRKCLCCNRLFRSTWDGHRVCSPCKESARWEDGAIDRETYSVRMS